MKAVPIQGEPFRFQVSSRSKDGHAHVVDWLANPPSCSCNAYAYNARNHFLEHGTPYLCAHLITARNQCWLEIIDDTKQKILAE